MNADRPAGKPSGTAVTAAGDGVVIPGPTGQSVTVRAGQAAVVPRGVIHRPSNASDQPVRFVFVSSPPMDEFFAELGLLTERGGGRLDAGVLADLGRRYDTVFPGLVPGTVTMRNEAR
jgi:Cupin domain